MSESGEVTHQTFEFDSLDGPRLVGDLAMASTVVGAAVVCHPHPQYGGTRFDQVVSAMFAALPGAGIATLRFDFRSAFSDGVGERLDALAAIDELEAAAPGVPLALVGYSFGAWVVLGLDDDRVDAMVAVAPPRTSVEIEFETIEMADHFLSGRTAAVADRAATWLSGRWRLPSLL